MPWTRLMTVAINSIAKLFNAKTHPPACDGGTNVGEDCVGGAGAADGCTSRMDTLRMTLDCSLPGGLPLPPPLQSPPPPSRPNRTQHLHRFALALQLCTIAWLLCGFSGRCVLPLGLSCLPCLLGLPLLSCLPARPALPSPSGPSN